MRLATRARRADCDAPAITGPSQNPETDAGRWSPGARCGATVARQPTDQAIGGSECSRLEGRSAVWSTAGRRTFQRHSARNRPGAFVQRLHEWQNAPQLRRWEKIPAIHCSGRMYIAPGAVMTTHRSHGHEYVQPERYDELSEGTPDASQARARAERKLGGARIPKGAKALPAAGGRAAKGTTTLSHRIEGTSLPEDALRRARTLRKALATEIATTVGGGICGVASSLFIKFASQKTAAAEVAFLAGDFELHRKLSESARMDILYSREHAAKTAQTNRGGALAPWLEPDDEAPTTKETP